MQGHVVLLSWVLVMGMLPCCDNARILILPAYLDSHLNDFSTVIHTFKDAGHQVYALFSDAYPLPAAYQSGPAAPHLLHYQGRGYTFTPHQEEFQQVQQLLSDSSAMMLYQHFLGPYVSLEMTKMLEDENCIKRVQALQFDLVVVDGAWKAYYLVPYHLQLPYITMTADLPEPLVARVPWLPSHLPDYGSPYADNMTFSQRYYNVLLNVIRAFTSDLPSPPPHLMAKYMKGVQVSLNALARQSELWIVSRDPLLDYIRPMMPHVVFVGGLRIQPAQPLSKEVATFLNASTSGVVIVNHVKKGIVGTYNKQMAIRILAAVSRLKQRAIVILPDAHALDIPDNVMTLTSASQTDLLAHHKVALLVSRCSDRDLQEALFFAVPLLCIPISPGQIYNARVISHKGFGLRLNTNRPVFSDEAASKAMNDIVSSSKHKRAIQTASDIFHHQPQTPKEKVTYWIDHVLKHGGGHFKSYVLQLPWYEYLMIDICVATIIFVLVIYITIKYTYRTIKWVYILAKEKKD